MAKNVILIGLCLVWQTEVISDPNCFEGNWQQVALVRHGMETPPDALKDIGLIIKGKTFYHGVLTNEHKFQEFEINDIKKPKEITLVNIVLDTRREIRCIYESNGDHLVLYSKADPSSRPTGTQPNDYDYKWTFRKKK
jgi:uncharacterized protein (TIGR03067 family)